MFADFLFVFTLFSLVSSSSEQRYVIKYNNKFEKLLRINKIILLRIREN